MLVNGESQREVIRPDFNRAIMIDFQVYLKIHGKLCYHRCH